MHSSTFKRIQNFISKLTSCKPSQNLKSLASDNGPLEVKILFDLAQLWFYLSNKPKCFNHWHFTQSTINKYKNSINFYLYLFIYMYVYFQQLVVKVGTYFAYNLLFNPLRPGALVRFQAGLYDLNFNYYTMPQTWIPRVEINKFFPKSYLNTSNWIFFNLNNTKKLNFEI